MSTMQIGTSTLDWNKKSQTFVLSNFSGEFPAYVDLVSHKTGKTIMFTKNLVLAEKNEWWDGEAYYYKSMNAEFPDLQLVLSRG